jgi:UDP-glucuronate decarboxylase
MDGDEIGPFNVGNPEEFSMVELAEIVKKVINPNLQIVYKKNTADDPMRRKPDITKIKNKYKWEPKVKLDEGLQYMITDFKERLNMNIY